MNVLESRLYLPDIVCPPATILDYLIGHFPHVTASEWRDRVAQGKVALDDGRTLNHAEPYRAGLTVLYQREVRGEPAPEELESIVYEDSEIIVADKPHGMPVTPAGDWVERSLLVRLRRRASAPSLTPMHRLDRETAGVVLFAIPVSDRLQYHTLFSTGNVRREYLAVAHVPAAPRLKHWHLESRIGAGDPWFRRQIVPGPANAVTDIELLELKGGLGLFRLKPCTGKKHQLRVHMSSLGFPIVGDPFYPEIALAVAPGRPPLQLLAERLEFEDPHGRGRRCFLSTRNLLWPAPVSDPLPDER